jgi:hypothetical protein
MLKSMNVDMVVLILLVSVCNVVLYLLLLRGFIYVCCVMLYIGFGVCAIYCLKKKPCHQQSLIDLIEVVRMTNDEDILRRFHDMGDNYTPIRVTFLYPDFTVIAFCILYCIFDLYRCLYYSNFIVHLQTCFC